MITRRLLVLLIACLVLSLHAQTVAVDSTGIPWIKRSLPGGAEKFTFAILGDKTGGGEENWPIFDRAVDEINRLDPDFVVMVGDLIQGYVNDGDVLEGMWKEYFAHAERLHVPLYLLPGNHDISNEMMYDYWRTHLGRTYYSLLYHNCLFLLLNTEEYKKTQDGQLGAEQLAFIQNQLEQNANVDQVFVFMHKPLWTMPGPAAGEWQRIASWLPQAKTTIFAGHHHRLLYEKRNGHRYVILAATGAGLSPMAVDELGRYHHYSLVTVEPDTAIVAIVKPGQILAETVATREFSEALDSIVSYQAFLEPDLSQSQPAASVSFDLHNPFDEPLDLRFEVQSEDTSGWEFQPMRMSLVLPKGAYSQQAFSGKYTRGSMVPLPVVRYTAIYKGETILSAAKALLPGRAADRRSPQQVQVVGPFDLGIRKRPPDQGDPQALVPRWFEKLGPESNPSLTKSYKTYKGKKRWQNVRIKNGFIDLDNLLGDQDFAIAYAQFTIRSPENQTVFAGVRPDNICRVFANGKMVISGEPLREVANQPQVFLLPLRKGENTILLKLAEYTGSWYTEFWVADPRATLGFD